MTSILKFLRIAGLLGLAAAAASAQQFPFQLLITSATSAVTVANDSAIGFNAEVGQSVTYHVTATYLPSNASNTVTVSQAAQILGATQFSVTNFPAMLPLTLNPGDKLTFDITYKPTSANSATAQLQVNFTETSPAQSGPPVTTQNAIILILQGVSPSIVLSYVLQTNLNVVPLQPGGTISFPGTLVNTTALANLNVSNGGSGSGQITAIVPPAGPAFKLTGIPLLPYTLPALQTLTLQVAYTPTSSNTDNDQLQIKLASGATLTVLLQGNGTSASFSYQLLSGDTPAPVTPPGPIALPDTNVGTTSSMTVRVQNIGNANGTLNAPSLAGQGFSLTDLPLFPQTLKPNDSFTFTINFAPTQPGTNKGTLVVGSDLFNLTGNGLGAKLTFSYISGGGTTTLNTGDSVIFSPIGVTQSEQVTFVIKNSGTQPARISNVGIGEAKSPFSLANVPSLPISLDPGASTQFNINFAPSTTGFSNGTLRVDGTVVGLTGSGTAPPPLPSYTIQGPSGNVTPQTQPSVRLTLANPYPVGITGTLTLTTSSNSVSDPAVQFSTGGRSVPFVIPANATSANFAGQGSQIFLQTGTVASTIILTPSFLTQDGGIDVTPSNPTALQFSVASLAPTLLAASVTSATTNSFVLNVTGFSTPRSLNTLNIQFAAASGFNFSSNTSVSVDIRQGSSAWFQSTASQAFGGQFEVSIQFTLTGTNLPTGKNPIQAIASVSATVVNDVGTSNSLQVSLQ